MKHIIAALIALFPLLSISQTYSGQNISLVNVISPNNDTIPSPVGNKYSGCWGWYQQSKNKEYAIGGASNGTYFIEITNPGQPVVRDFVPGRRGSTWREIKTYQNICYIACDDAKPNTFQIVDMQYLPDSVHVIHSSNALFERGHTLFVDNNKLYVGGITFSASTAPMAIFSLATPTAPVLLKVLDSDISTNLINYVHDMHVRNDTIYASTGNSGLYVLKYNGLTNSVTVLGSYTGYPYAGYNHSSFLTQNGKYLMFCDEVPGSLPINMVDVQNLSNIQPKSSFMPRHQTTAHNPYMIGNNFAIVSCYQDGLFIYDISQPQNIKEVGWFDTHPQGGFNTGTYGNQTYSGNWGAYPWLPSGLIVASDMQNGFLVLNAAAAYTTTQKTGVNAVGLSNVTSESKGVDVYPNPAKSRLFVSIPGGKAASVQVRTVTGSLVLSQEFRDTMTAELSVDNLSKGLYFVTVTTNGSSTVKKIQVAH